MVILTVGHIPFRISGSRLIKCHFSEDYSAAVSPLARWTRNTTVLEHVLLSNHHYALDTYQDNVDVDVDVNHANVVMEAPSTAATTTPNPMEAVLVRNIKTRFRNLLDPPCKHPVCASTLCVKLHQSQDVNRVDNRDAYGNDQPGPEERDYWRPGYHCSHSHNHRYSRLTASVLDHCFPSGYLHSGDC
jgi:hypothetical protein